MYVGAEKENLKIIVTKHTNCKINKLLTTQDIV